ncbi:MAG: calcium-binding protein [Pseudomonadales bacterium]
MEENQQQQENENKEESKDEAASEATAVAVMQAIKEAMEQTQAAQQHTAIDQKKSDAKKSSVDEEGVFVDPRPPIVEKSSSSGISFNVDEAPESPEQKPLFDIRLLQPSKVNEVQDGIPFVRGGGGSEASAFDPSNESQYSTETINLATSNVDLVVEADHSGYFSETRMTRVIELQPILPAGFKPSRLLIEGLPDGFVIEGAVRTANGYELIDPSLDVRGNVRVNLVYPVPSDDEFTLHIKLEARFDATARDENGFLLVPPLQTFMETEGDQKVVVRNVFGAEDLNYFDADGDFVWVLANNPNENRIFTGSGNDSITGAVATDVVDAGDGNDWIFGARGDDTLIGGRGNDTLIGGLGSDLLEGGAGSDTADYSAYAVRIIADLMESDSGAAYVTIDPDGDLFEEDRLRQVENILSGSADDVLIGDDADNSFNGGAGSDLLIGHGGFDTLDGAGGVDTVDYSDSAKAITANLSETTNNVTVDSGDIDTVLNVENFIATDFDDRVIGSAEADTIFGGLGNDRLSGGRGNDHLDGGEGEGDFADFSDAVTGVVLNLGETPDANGYTTAVMGAEVDHLRNLEHVTGSAYADRITGSDAGQILQGAGGDDTIAGAGGDDTIDGQEGNDVLAGDAGNDRFLVSHGLDRLDGGAGLDTIDFSGFADATAIHVELAGAADGTIVVTGSENQIVRNLENVIATAGDDTLFGDASDNVLEGRDGNDVLAGGAGDDTLIGGDGRDSADYSRVGSGVDLDLSTGVVLDDGQGGQDVILEIEDLTGSSYDDVLVGDRFANVLTGGGGDDVLQGRGGDDTLVGGQGSDTASYSQAPRGVTIDLAAVALVDDGEGGEDTFISIENLEGSSFSDTLTGDDGDNTLSGLGGNDTLDGGLGVDLLEGGTGDDHLLTSLGADTFDGGEGSDWADYSSLGAASAITVTLNGAFDAVATIAGQDNDVLRGIENVSGTAGADVLRGDVGQNFLFGNDGNDTISGGSGADQLDGGQGFDQLRFDDLAGAGVVLDLATSSALYRGDSSVDSFAGFEIYLGSLQADEIISSAASEYRGWQCRQ